MRGRGLKLLHHLQHGLAPGSPPMRGRGLKLARLRDQGHYVKSPPMRGRGLKLLMQTCVSSLFSVAPHAGAWIETLF